MADQLEHQLTSAAMTKAVLFLTGAMLSATATSAQNASANYSYNAPSGMFGEGSAKWGMYRFMAEEAERRSAIINIPSGRQPALLTGTPAADMRHPTQPAHRRLPR